MFLRTFSGLVQGGILSIRQRTMILKVCYRNRLHRRLKVSSGFQLQIEMDLPYYNIFII